MAHGYKIIRYFTLTHPKCTTGSRINKIQYKKRTILTKDKIIEIFYIADDFCKEFDMEVKAMTEKRAGIAPVPCLTVKR
jgi:hypothetical protein